jgi:hypothetical protein
MSQTGEKQRQNITVRKLEVKNSPRRPGMGRGGGREREREREIT